MYQRGKGPCCSRCFGSGWIRIDLVVWIRIRIGNSDPYPGGQKRPTKIEKSYEIISCFEVLDVFFSGVKASVVDWTSIMEAYSRDN
jgi:hypothetical protein